MRQRRRKTKRGSMKKAGEKFFGCQASAALLVLQRPGTENKRERGERAGMPRLAQRCLRAKVSGVSQSGASRWQRALRMPLAARVAHPGPLSGAIVPDYMWITSYTVSRLCKSSAGVRPSVWHCRLSESKRARRAELLAAFLHRSPGSSLTAMCGASRS